MEEENSIDLEGVIGWEVTASGVKRQLRNMGDVDEINVYINSPGGYIDDGFGIYTALKNHAATVNMHITGMAASMASVIAMAGDTVTIEDTGMMMIHPPSNIAWGTALDLRKGADVLDKYESRIVKAYTRRDLSLSDEQLDEAIAAETWYTSDEAVEAGLVDSISEGPQREASEESRASALSWMKVAAYKNTPDELAEKLGMYKRNNFSNAATKNMVKALATDGSAVETESETMTDEVTYTAADIEQAVANERDRITAMLSHKNGSNTEAVVKIANMGLSVEQSSDMLDLVASPEASADEGRGVGDEAEAQKTDVVADMKAMFETMMQNSEVNGVNLNAGGDSEESSPKHETVDQTYDRVMNGERGVLQ